MLRGAAALGCPHTVLGWWIGRNGVGDCRFAGESRVGFWFDFGR